MQRPYALAADHRDLGPALGQGHQKTQRDENESNWKGVSGDEESLAMVKISCAYGIWPGVVYLAEGRRSHGGGV